jgi:hypothetical protein
VQYQFTTFSEDTGYDFNVIPSFYLSSHSSIVPPFADLFDECHCFVILKAVSDVFRAMFFNVGGGNLGFPDMCGE